MPDVCGQLENPEIKNEKRYKIWFNKYLAHEYVVEVGHDQTRHVLLNAEDFYALRCSYLHEGSIDITGQRARRVLDRFQFISISEGNNISIHNNRVNEKLQLQVNIFCEQICVAAEQWIRDFENDQNVLRRLNQLLVIQHIDNGITI